MKIVKIRLTQVDQVREFVELTSNCNYDVDPLQVVIYGDDSEEYEKALEKYKI